MGELHGENNPINKFFLIFECFLDGEYCHIGNYL